MGELAPQSEDASGIFGRACADYSKIHARIDLTQRDRPASSYAYPLNIEVGHGR